VAAGLQEAGIESAWRLAGGLLLGPGALAAYVRGAAPVTDDRPRVEFPGYDRPDVRFAYLVAVLEGLVESAGPVGEWAQGESTARLRVEQVREGVLLELRARAAHRRAEAAGDFPGLLAAEELYRRAQARLPEDPGVAYHLRHATWQVIMMEAGSAADPWRAAERCQQAIAIDPDRPEAHESRAWALLRAGSQTGAETAAQVLLARWPRNPEGHVVLAQLCADAGRVEDAREHLARALAVQPDHPGARELEAALTSRSRGP